MNEEGKGKLLLVIGLLVIVGIMVIFVLDYQRQEKIIKGYNELFEKEGTQIVYFGKDGCSYCQLYQPVIDEMMKTYELSYYYVNSGVLNSGKLISMLEKGKVDYENFGTPTTLIIKDGEAVANHSGYMDREQAFTFLQDNGLIGKDETLKPEFENLTDITYREYETLLKSKTPKVVVVGQTTCTHCITAKPYYDEIAREEEIEIYYLNYSKLTSEEQVKLNESTTYFKENPSWGTPLMLIVQNGDSVDVDSGFANKNVTLSFLRENNIVD